MVSGGRAWCGGLLGVLLVAVVVALETYEELPGVDDVAYQDDNDIDTGPRTADKRLSPSLAKDVMLYRILKALQLQDYPHYKSPNSPNDVNAEEQHKPDDVYFKDAMYKRFSNGYNHANTALRTPELALRPHKKWKIKKGKAIGSQMVCYFKLCAFRSPA